MWPQGGTTEGDGLVNDVIYAAAAGEDGPVVLAGSTNGQWGGPNKGGSDFAAVKLNAEGGEIGRWQVRSDSISREAAVGTTAMYL